MVNLFEDRWLHEAARDEVIFPAHVVGSGDLSKITNLGVHSVSHESIFISGASSHPDLSTAKVLAVGEAVERYSATSGLADYCVVSTARELGALAMDLSSIPTCSELELRHPSCPIYKPNVDAKMRWVQGVNLTTGKLAYIPAVMVYLYYQPLSFAENFWLTNSSGCACHPDLAVAAESAILELIERDALSIMWLQRMPSPEILIDAEEITESPEWAAYQRSSRELQYRFFALPNDSNTFVVYSIQLAPRNERLSTLVACAASLDPVKAIKKTIRDLAIYKNSCRFTTRIPEDWDDFSDPHHGAQFMAHRARRSAFDFMLKGEERVSLSKLSASAKNRRCSLKDLVTRLSALDLDVFLVDLTSREAADRDLRVVRAIIPGLHPLTFHYRARFLGNRRLYELPRSLGELARSEWDLNHWPQPFA